MVAAVVWERKGVLMVDVLEREATIIANLYSATVDMSCHQISSPWCVSKVCYSSMTVPGPHMAAFIRDLMQHFRWESLDTCQTVSPVQEPYVLRLSLVLEEQIRGHRLQSVRDDVSKQR